MTDECRVAIPMARGDSLEMKTAPLKQTVEDDLLVEEPMNLDVDAPALMGVPAEPDDDYPSGTGPFG